MKRQWVLSLGGAAFVIVALLSAAVLPFGCRQDAPPAAVPAFLSAPVSNVSCLSVYLQTND